MAVEIERKFLVTGSSWKRGARGVRYRQGYLCASRGRSVRVRIGGRKAFLTIKGETRGAERAEFEYAVPLKDAAAILKLCDGGVIDKTRYTFRALSMTWEVDVFHGDNRGLVVAEVELARRRQKIVLPDWVGKEVTDDPRYYSASLMRRPFSKWR